MCLFLFKGYLIRKGGIIINKKENTKDWIPVETILENGIIKNKNKFIKIIKILPINYDLKSNLEKEAIINSYKLFLKTCDFDIQIFIQSKKESLDQYILNLNEISKKEKNNKIKEITQNYINFIKNKNDENRSASKNFFMIISEETRNDNHEYGEISEGIAINNLNEKYLKIKDSLTRCGNIVFEINTKEEVINLLLLLLRKK